MSTAPLWSEVERGACRALGPTACQGGVGRVRQTAKESTILVSGCGVAEDRVPVGSDLAS